MRLLLPATTVGKKILMGTTGLIWIGFVVAHVAGNLLVFRGPSALNGYSALLHSSAVGLWVARSVIYGALLLHIASGLALWDVSAKARRETYARKAPQAATLSSKTIRWTGLAMLVFIVFHILHLSTGTIHPVPYEPGNVYSNVTRGFHVPWVAALYMVAMVAVTLHVSHGIYASFKSLGWARLRANPFDRRLAIVVAIVIWVGFTVIPATIVARVLG